MRIGRLENENFFELVKFMNYYRAEVNEPPLGAEYIAGLYEGVENGDIAFYVVTENDNIVGMCSVSVLYSSYKCAYAGFLDNAYILPDYRKRGIFRRLIDYVFAALEGNGVKSLFSISSSIDEGMYKALGFDDKLGVLLARSAK